MKEKNPSKGRKANAAAEFARHRVRERDTNDTSRLVKMAPRAVRRTRQGKEFRPVYHHGIPVSPDHKSVIAAMTAVDRKTSLAWQQEVNLGRAFVSFGLSVALFLEARKVEATKARHEMLRATGQWIEHVRR